MRPARLIGVPLLVCCGLLAACSDDDGSSAGAPSSSTAAPAVCGSVEDLQASLAAFPEVPVTVEGLGTLREALGQVASEVTQVVDDARSQFETQADALTASLSAVQTSVESAVSAPSAASLDAVGTSVRALADTTAGLASDVSSSC
ncbi:conserved exported protein of unknown function [Modestobacter italicus]|uniref:Secreted protein n=1 Tax=Modestobacter italicus (strain DSM 44449 / CECT 9708 / BC 501) TaxID=2732864 RepID=I4EWH9_MODI5|nr:hypothetical protein [Modestobacter marinus]CCH87742.1 conserved exported protein of unknown function [Modestobacter marinus]